MNYEGKQSGLAAKFNSVLRSGMIFSPTLKPHYFVISLLLDWLLSVRWHNKITSLQSPPALTPLLKQSTLSLASLVPAHRLIIFFHSQTLFALPHSNWPELTAWKHLPGSDGFVVPLQSCFTFSSAQLTFPSVQGILPWTSLKHCVSWSVADATGLIKIDVKTAIDTAKRERFTGM